MVQSSPRRLVWDPHPGLARRQARLFQTLGKRGRIEILTYLLRHAREEHTVRELAALARVPTMTAARAVDDLYGIGILRRRRIGGAYAVSLDPESDATASVRKLIDLARYE